MKTNASTPRSKGSTAFKSDALNGEGRAWGVLKAGGVVYECMFVERTAKRLAQLDDQKPAANWHQHKAALQREAFDLSDPGTAANQAETCTLHTDHNQ